MKEIIFQTDIKKKEEYTCYSCKDTGIIHNWKNKGIEVCQRCLKAGRLG
jgi:ribosomal protein L37AE/L43A